MKHALQKHFNQIHYRNDIKYLDEARAITCSRQQGKATNPIGDSGAGGQKLVVNPTGDGGQSFGRRVGVVGGVCAVGGVWVLGGHGKFLQLDKEFKGAGARQVNGLSSGKIGV